MFNQTGVHPRRVVQVLTKVLFLLNHGESIGTTEATEVFFAITKLFQSKDVSLELRFKNESLVVIQNP